MDLRLKLCMCGVCLCLQAYDHHPCEGQTLTFGLKHLCAHVLAFSISGRRKWETQKHENVTTGVT
jgi:hypothetical protein